MLASRPRLIAYYLPQFHPTKENDEWWGQGFTEWTNTARAKPRFPGHYQPHVPSTLGFYDLRLAETRAAQADLARQYGIEGFCYYHYWLGNGRRMLERPFNEVLASGQPDFPFCLCWANHSWSGIWAGAPDRTLIEQQYPGAIDDEMHFQELLPAFKDPRYMCIDGKPIFVVWYPFEIPNVELFVKRWRVMAKQAGLPGLHLVGCYWPGREKIPEHAGFDASIYNNNPPLRSWGSWRNPVKFVYYRCLRALGIPTILSYEKAINYHLPESMPQTQYPSVVHAWDNTPRSGVNGLVLRGSTPTLFRGALRKAFALTRTHQGQGRLVFLKSWNEWAEGNHLEPDLRDGHGYLRVILEELENELRTPCGV